ncbi:MAG: 5'/3'-nucleotidase SurE [Negativicutes bacterium]|jgi:5'-nucleotidase
MHILVSNDDGINAKGIRALVEELAKIARITVVAPDGERSAQSQALTINQPLMIHEQDLIIANVTAYRVEGTPADCVKLALGEILLNDIPDLIITGINHGPNLGTDILYSGTVGAAIEGLTCELPAIAVSLVTWGGYEWDFSVAARYAARIAPQLVANHRSTKRARLININVPNIPEEKLRGAVVTTMGVLRYENVFERRTDPRGRVYYWMGGAITDDAAHPTSDVEAIRAGKISLTPLMIDFTDYSMTDVIRKWDI